MRRADIGSHGNGHAEVAGGGGEDRAHEVAERGFRHVCAIFQRRLAEDVEIDEEQQDRKDRRHEGSKEEVLALQESGRPFLDGGGDGAHALVAFIKGENVADTKSGEGECDAAADEGNDQDFHETSRDVVSDVSRLAVRLLRHRHDRRSRPPTRAQILREPIRTINAVENGVRRYGSGGAAAVSWSRKAVIWVSRRRWSAATVRSPRVRSVTPRTMSVLLRRPCVIASG